MKLNKKFDEIFAALEDAVICLESMESAPLVQEDIDMYKRAIKRNTYV